MPPSTVTPTIHSTSVPDRRFSRILREMWRGLISSRYIAYRLVVKDVRAENAKNALGIFWDFVDPMVLGAIFYLLSLIGIVRSGMPEMPFVVFVVYGVLLYETFSESILLTLNVIQRSKNILTHLKVPPEALILSVLFRVLFNSLFRIAIMLSFSLFLSSTAAAAGQSSFSLPGFLGFLLFFPAIILAGLSIGVLLAPFNVIYSDVGRFVKVALIPLRYATPVFYAIPATAENPALQTLLSIVHNCNPVAFLLVNLRSLATAGVITDIPQTVICVIFFFTVFLIGWVIFHLAIPVLADRA
ncbi:MAG: hypothetical protein KC940_15025 [Candidatus Omnitrophica bacterium]|nr:hypothetical protein [Candidatus Omnitrophota bacterium]